MNKTISNTECVKVCNSLLRGELSAEETYQKALEKHSDSPAAGELARIQGEHRNSARRLTENIRLMGGEPDADSGAWGTFAKTIQSTANLFGSESAIKSLQQGEEHGRNDYQDALENDDVAEDCKAMIKSDLLPAVERHITALKALEEAAD